VSVLLNIILLFSIGLSSGMSSDRDVRETVLIPGDSKQRIAVIPIVNSMMLQAQADQLDKMLSAAEKDDTIKAVVLRVDTPGGEVTSADEMYHRILDFKSKKPNVKVTVSMGGLACSGGYYAACAGDTLFAEKTTLTGNIGVLMPNYNFSKLAEKYGVEDTTIHSTGADYKTAGDWLKPPSDKDTQYLTGLIDSMFGQFKSVVTTGRNGRLKQPIESIANGMAYGADDALKLGLVDQIGYLTDACTFAESQAGSKGMQVVQYEKAQSFLQALTEKSNLPALRASGGVQFNVDAQTLSQLQSPRMLYMWRP
jgi:protease IV